MIAAYEKSRQLLTNFNCPPPPWTYFSIHSIDCGCVDIPLRFQANTVGQFTCQMVLRSWCDTRVYMLEALVTSQVDINQYQILSL